MPPLIPEGLGAEILRPPPHRLNNAVAELIFLSDGQIVFCSQEDGRHTAKFVSPEDAKRAFDPVLTDSGWLPPDIIRWGVTNGKEWAVLFKPEQIYTITLIADTFTTEGGVLGNRQEPEQGQRQSTVTLRVPLPSFVVLTLAREMCVWAIKEKQFSPHAKIHQVPLPNISHQGRVCFGANEHEPASLQTANSVWDAWVTAAFTGESKQGKSKAFPDDVRRQLVSVQGKQKYPKNDLVEYRHHWNEVGQAVEQAIKGGA